MSIYSGKIQHNYFIFSFSCTKGFIHVWNIWYICVIHPIVSVLSFILVKFLSSKGICTCTHYVLHYYKVSWNSVERFQRSCADKKNRTDRQTDWLTDWRTDGRVKNIIPSATHCVGYNYIELGLFIYYQLTIEDLWESGVETADTSTKKELLLIKFFKYNKEHSSSE